MPHEEQCTPEELAEAAIKVREQLKGKMEAIPTNAAYWLDEEL